MNNKLQIFYPLILVGVLAGGIFLGMSLADNSPANPIIFKGNDRDKFAKVVRYVEQEYVDSVNTGPLVEEAIQDFLQSLDPHSYYISAEERAAYSEPLEGNFDGIGVEFRIVKDTVVVVNPITGGPSEKVGILAGDRIVTVEDSLIAGVGITNRDVMDLLRGKKDTKVKVGILRGKNEDLQSVIITRGEIPIVSIPVALKADDRTGYIRITRFARNTFEEFKQALNEIGPGKERLIIDLRGNGGGYLQTAIALADEFLKEGELIVYTEGENQERRTYEASGRGKLQDIELIILQNEGSASASEILAGAIQDNDRGVIIGRRSFGKGLVQDEIPFPDNSAMRLTIARYYTPAGRCIQRPYGEDVDYEGDYSDRLQGGELLSADSISFPDSLRFTTKTGRTVYGGGGIMPDIFIPVDTTANSEFLSEALYSGALNRFCFQYADEHRTSLTDLGDARGFDSGFQVNEMIFQEFLAFCAEEDIEPTADELSRSREELDRRIAAGVARVIHGESGYFQIFLKDDKEYQAALGYGSDALISQKQ